MNGEHAEQAPRTFAFGPFTLIPKRQLLLKSGAPVRIGSRALDILTTLVECPGEVVSKRDLFARAWPNTIVEESNLKVNMAALRRVLGEGPGATQYIATVTSRGYRFVVSVQRSILSELSADENVALPRNHNLPIATTRVVGRQDAIDAIWRELADTRLVSIVGTGGIGKTTVALAVAERAVGMHRDGVWLVDLSTLKDPALVPNAIATAIGLAAHSANMLAALSGFLRNREMLLVLDSCEHIVDTVAACVDRILVEAVGVKILATSREPLRVKGERVRRLQGLGTPPESAGLKAEAALCYPAVELFVDRVKDSLASFRLNDEEAPWVAEICRRMDGIALAIELAATRVDAFGIGGLREQLADRLSLLQGHRGGVERHRALTATIDWSYDLLSDSERMTMRRLATFAGAFSLESALAVVAEDIAERATRSVDIANLVAKSLLTAEVRDTEVEYRQLDTTRAYALEKLMAHQELTAARRRHAEYFLETAERAEKDARRLPADAWLACYAAKIDDIRDALRWASASPDDVALFMRLTMVGIPFWKRLSLLEECTVAVERALSDHFRAHRSARNELILHLTLGATLLHTRGPLLQVKSSLSTALGIAEALADTSLQLECLHGISEYELWTGDSHSAIAVAEKIHAIANQRDGVASVDADAQAGSALSWLGALEASRHRLERIAHGPVSHSWCSDAVRFEFDQRLTARGSLATVLWLQGFPDQALDIARRQLKEAEASNYAVSLCYALVHSSVVVSLYVRDYEAAGHYLDRGVEHATKHGLNVWRTMAIGTRGRWSLYTGQPVDLIAYREVLAELRESGFRMRYPNYLTNYGEALARQGDLEGGLAAIDEAIALCKSSGQVVGIPEMLRIKGNVLLFGDPARSEKAAAYYLESIELARRDGALSWELRTAISLVKFWRQYGGNNQAEDTLASAYGRFNEGFATGDLKRARALLGTRQAV